MPKHAAALLVVLTVLPFTAPFAAAGAPAISCDRAAELPSVHAPVHAAPTIADDAIARLRPDFRGAFRFCALGAVAASGATLQHTGSSLASTPSAAAIVLQPRSTVLRI